MNLAEDNEPLILADGTKIDPVTGDVITDPVADYIEVPNNQEAVQTVLNVRRRIDELPDIPKNMQGVSVILSYTLFGLSDDDIAIATGLTIEQVGNIKMSDTYTKFSDNIVEGLMKSEQSNVRDIISAGSRKAAQKVVNLVNSKHDALAFAAAKDILDRDGHRPADVIEHRHTMDDSLEIIVTYEKDNELPPIDVEYSTYD